MALIVSLLMSRYVVDSADMERIPESKEELFELLERPVLAGIPLLVLGNKNDLREAISVEKLIDEMFVLFKVETN
jgi:ADP-ribosylation factor-like protein 8